MPATQSISVLPGGYFAVGTCKAAMICSLTTPEFLGQMLGVRRTSVSTVANALQQAGLIRYSRGNIRILDLEGVRTLACECYETVKAHAYRLIGHQACGDGRPA